MAELGLHSGLMRAFAFAFGLLWGSFLNVVIYRVPRDLSVVRPGSACPSCKTPIAFYDNIPVLSYVLLGGRTRCCKTKMSPRYPVVEIIGGMLVLAVFMHLERTMAEAAAWKFGVVLLAESALCLSLAAAAFIDAEFMILPDEITYGGAILGFLTSPLRGYVWWQVLAAGVAVVVFTMGFNALYKLVRKRSGIGMGDVKLLALAGAWFGGPGVFFVLFAASIQGAIGAVLLRVLIGPIEIPDEVKKEIEEMRALAAEGNEEAIAELADDPLAKDGDGFMQAAIPFGPFLIFACFEFLFFEPQITRLWHAYLDGGLFNLGSR